MSYLHLPSPTAKIMENKILLDELELCADKFRLTYSKLTKFSVQQYFQCSNIFSALRKSVTNELRNRRNEIKLQKLRIYKRPRPMKREGEKWIANRSRVRGRVSGV